MKKLIVVLVGFILLSCKKEVNNPYFTSDEIYNTVVKSIETIHTDISKNTGLFYVFNRHDTLIVMAAEYQNVIYPTFRIKKEGTFYTDCCKIIVTQPYNPKFNIIKKDNKLKQNDISDNLGLYNGDPSQKGMIYKIKDLNHLELIDKGNLSKYFYSIKEYEIPAPPPPPDHK